MSGGDLLALIEPEVPIRLALAIIFGGTIGYERELRGRAAGLRTMTLVCMGSALVMIVSSHLAAQYGPGDGVQLVRFDPSRIAAGIVTGIGFLGAGVILKLGDLIRGVTTAATIWFVAGLGIAIGDGRYMVAVWATLAGLFVLMALSWPERLMRSHIYRTITLRTEGTDASSVAERAKDFFTSRRMRVMDLRVRADSANSELEFYVRTVQQLQAAEIVRDLSALEGVTSVEWR